jgi:thiol-disulfide isomerase/thioredoxin
MSDDDMEEVMMTNDGPMAPEFTFTDLAGNQVSSADLKGERVYLKYWASWCSICLAGLGDVDELAASDKDFTFYTVVTPGANGEQSKEDFITWFNGLGYENIEVLFDEGGTAGRELNVRAFPTSVFIGSDGVLIEALPGHKSNEQILEKVDSFY